MFIYRDLRGLIYFNILMGKESFVGPGFAQAEWCWALRLLFCSGINLSEPVLLGSVLTAVEKAEAGQAGRKNSATGTRV